MKFCNYLYLQLFLAFTFCNAHNNVIFIIDTDLFIEENRSRTAWDVGPSKFFTGFYNPAKIINNYFASLDQIVSQNRNSPTVIKYGLTLPQLIKNWLSNTISADQARIFAHDELKKLEKRTGNSTKLYRAIADHMFTPHRYAKVRDCNKEGFKLVKSIHDQRDMYGNRKYKICGFTNQNAESYRELCNNREIKAALDLCDEVFVSGNLHMLKPDPAFFDYVFKKLDIKDNDLVIYIDIEISFIIVANSLGKKNLHCIHCKDYNLKTVYNDLRNLGVIL